ncbi:hypothetical protein PIB30_026102 [Stylosanthes scabra]|uniref:Uncharacterized protein n=1 Tax=Stylosanthes scabra TaxID=79078 RepID=A0ABU6SA97_9FABA|nr:hypothetical protein [Stylosanthes scabra]
MSRYVRVVKETDLKSVGLRPRRRSKMIRRPVLYTKIKANTLTSLPRPVFFYSSLPSIPRFPAQTASPPVPKAATHLHSSPLLRLFSQTLALTPQLLSPPPAATGKSCRLCSSVSAVRPCSSLKLHVRR